MTKLKEIRAREAKAAPGPWKYYSGQRGVYSADGKYVCTRAGYMGKLSRHFDDANMPFITHARSDIPYLIARVERLEAALAEVTTALAQTYVEKSAADSDPRIIRARAALEEQSNEE